MSKERTEVNWRASKMGLAGFVMDLYDRLAGENRGFYDEAGAGHNVDGLI